MTYDEVENERNFGIYGDWRAEAEQEALYEMEAIRKCEARSRWAHFWKKCECGYHE